MPDDCSDAPSESARVEKQDCVFVKIHLDSKLLSQDESVGNE